MPTDTFIIIWTIIIMLLLIMTAIFTPYTASFIEDGDLLFDKLDLVFAIGYGIDLIINFLLAYQDPAQGIVTNLKMISKHYIKSWFLIDLLAM